MYPVHTSATSYDRRDVVNLMTNIFIDAKPKPSVKEEFVCLIDASNVSLNLKIFKNV